MTISVVSDNFLLKTFLSLDEKTCARCASVCKKWNVLIKENLPYEKTAIIVRENFAYKIYNLPSERHNLSLKKQVAPSHKQAELRDIIKNAKAHLIAEDHVSDITWKLNARLVNSIASSVRSDKKKIGILLELLSSTENSTFEFVDSAHKTHFASWDLDDDPRRSSPDFDYLVRTLSINLIQLLSLQTLEHCLMGIELLTSNMNKLSPLGVSITLTQVHIEEKTLSLELVIKNIRSMIVNCSQLTDERKKLFEQLNIYFICSQLLKSILEHYVRAVLEVQKKQEELLVSMATDREKSLSDKTQEALKTWDVACVIGGEAHVYRFPGLPYKHSTTYLEEANVPFIAYWRKDKRAHIQEMNTLGNADLQDINVAKKVISDGAMKLHFYAVAQLFLRVMKNEIDVLNQKIVKYKEAIEMLNSKK